MNNGWIKIHRKLIDNCIYKDSELLHLLIHCLIKANHRENTFLFNGNMVKVERGQFISGRFEISRETKIKTSSVYRKLKILEKLGILNIKSNNKFSVITVIKYNTYQDVLTTSDQQTEQQLNNKRTTTEQQLNTNKNDKNYKNEENEGDRKTSCFFENSEYYDFNRFKEVFLSNPKYSKYDVNFYYEAVKNWSESTGAKKKDWIATARGFAHRDDKENKAKLKPISYKSENNGKHDPSTAHL